MRRSSKITLALLVTPLLAAPLVHCGGQAQTATPPQPAAAPSASTAPSESGSATPPPPREDGRLPALATPARYALAFTIDPTQPRFQGRATILVDVAAPTRHLVLHGRDLTITKVTADVGGQSIDGTAQERLAHGALHPDELVLTFPSALPAGRVTLTIAYDAPFANSLSGLYRVKEGDRWYAFTQFESTDARRAFPCFDEPGFKVPFDVTITAPAGMLAVTNVPEKAKTAADGGATRFEFASTPPLPSYLVAMAVGDFDVREGATTPIPIRLISTKGKAALGTGALDAAQGIVTKLGEYFGVRYPYPKLDLVAVPDFAAGAMENPGLVTFREELLLQEPKRASVEAKRRQALVIAHELAHIWFGDLVTAQWWNDIWLNEGFATWMESKVVDMWRPAFQARLARVAATQEVMDLDALSSARAVRQPVTSTSEAQESFDQITYQKGSAVLGMIEHWVGEETFQKGVRDYIQTHAWKNAKAEDLLTALDKASGRDVSGMAATFLDRAGVPNVAVKESCDAGKPGAYALTQSAWEPLGIRGKAKAPWTIPVCIDEATPASKKLAACTDLSAERGQIAPASAKCAPWTYPNANEAGYYRFSLPEKDVRALATNRAQLDVANRVGLVSNLWAQVRAGELGADVLLDTLPAFDGETDRSVLGRIAAVLYDVDATLVDDASRPAFQAYVRARFAGHKRALGWGGATESDDDKSLARTTTLLVLGQLGDDPATLREAEAKATAWLKDPASVEPNVAAVALRLASIRAGKDRFDALRAAAKSAKQPLDRVTALRAIGGFTDPNVLRDVFDWMLTDDVKMQDFRYILGGEDGSILQRHASSMVFLKWLESHWPQVRAKMPGGLASHFVTVVRSACTAPERESAQAFFGPLVPKLEGAPRPYAEALEESNACTELRSHGSAAVSAYLAKRGKAAPVAKK